jgi:hypothetical protein
VPVTSGIPRGSEQIARSAYHCISEWDPPRGGIRWRGSSLQEPYMSSEHLRKEGVSASRRDDPFAHPH